MHPLDHAYAILVAVALPVFAALFSWPKMRERFGELNASERAFQYWVNSIALLAIAGLALWLWSDQGRDPVALGLGAGNDRVWIVLALGALFVGVISGVYRAALRTRQTRRKALRELLREAPIVPRERADLPHWTGVSIAAGVGEEIIYRGFLIWYFARLTGTDPMGLALAALLASAIFGVAHLYQGPRSAIKVGGLAFALGGLYVWCGALWPVMAIHFAVDLAAGLFAIRLHELTRSDAGPKD